MSVLHAVLAFVVVQRLGELALASANTRRLRRLGGIESDRLGYPLFVALHGAWLASLAFVVPTTVTPSWPLLGLFGGLQFGRLWVIASLGRRWTTRLVVLPQAAPVRTGPYRFLRHPNYLIVVCEIAVLPLAFGAVGVALVFSVANAVLLARRIRLEDRALEHASPAVTELSQSGRSAPMTSH
jgi:methyltransferase